MDDSVAVVRDDDDFKVLASQGLYMDLVCVTLEGLLIQLCVGLLIQVRPGC
jgi:hypothetical protein